MHQLLIRPYWVILFPPPIFGIVLQCFTLQDCAKKMQPFKYLILIRAEICHDRHNRQSCKIRASCVNFSKKRRVFLHNFVEVQDLHTPTVILHLNCCNFTHSFKGAGAFHSTGQSKEG